MALEAHVMAPYCEKSWSPNPDYINCVRIGNPRNKWCGAIHKSLATMLLAIVGENRKFSAPEIAVDECDCMVYIGGEELTYEANVREEVAALEKKNKDACERLMEEVERMMRRFGRAHGKK